MFNDFASITGKLVQKFGLFKQPNKSHLKVKREDLNEESRRGRPRRLPIKVTIPPLYTFIRNLLYNFEYNPSVAAWVNELEGSFRITK